jgi:hypothetical protein
VTVCRLSPGDDTPRSVRRREPTEDYVGPAGLPAGFVGDPFPAELVRILPLL